MEEASESTSEDAKPGVASDEEEDELSTCARIVGPSAKTSDHFGGMASVLFATPDRLIGSASVAAKVLVKSPDVCHDDLCFANVGSSSDHLHPHHDQDVACVRRHTNVSSQSVQHHYPNVADLHPQNAHVLGVVDEVVGHGENARVKTMMRANGRKQWRVNARSNQIGCQTCEMRRRVSDLDVVEVVRGVSWLVKVV